MIIKPSIRSNFFTNAHPLGCKQNVVNQINEAKKYPKFKGPKNVLIIGGSSGYGLASRIALAYGAGSNTINVSFENDPKGSKTGSAGWWNNIYFQEFAKETGNIHKDFVGDAFSLDMKNEVVKFVKENLGNLDLVIYSLASGGRLNYETNELIRSHIKAIGEEAEGKTIDIIERKIRDLKVATATEQDIEDTIFVMGGSDWNDWIDILDDHQILNHRCKTIAYTYIGGPTTEKIYRGGTIGKAKEDLENHAKVMNQLLKTKYEGEALISSSKAVTTKASVFIPQMTIYVSCLFDVMVRRNVHETILGHKYRLFKDMIYGSNRITDQENRIRLDHLEMDEAIQEETIKLMTSSTNDEILSLKGTDMFLKEFYQINGFEFDNIDYEKEVDLDTLSEKKPY
ncbi:enoyl-ACP reductase FabV [Peloplasma aerotolerans]|uniref:trans-2-enoyl-CoA reductase (NAD(+)) n=1 Tax=Peloplasma aerotolerans TaxID=3044389 RepID=A0AAW6UE81_9MOLU|nr:enoyl-ACP reductase FabV [Mariniplasma sp. M4Ah]MDI6453313.1 trans-2-enoyl-CoA reductase family protein [Mariniplasma sp. M4Ah]